MIRACDLLQITRKQQHIESNPLIYFHFHVPVWRRFIRDLGKENCEGSIGGNCQWS